VRQDSGRNPPRTPDAPSARERKEIARVHRGIEKAQADVRRRARPQPSLEPISKAKARTYALRPHPSEKQVRADVVAWAALRHLQGDIARSRSAAPGPGVSGYRFLASAVGPDLAALLPGTLTPTGRRPHATKRGVAMNVLSLSPFLRGPLTVARTVNAARRGKALAEVARAARPRPTYWHGPGQRALTRPLLTEVNAQNKVNPVPDYNHDGIVDTRDLIEHMRRGNRPWQTHHHR
jgi:hypothetical protein